MGPDGRDRDRTAAQQHPPGFVPPRRAGQRNAADAGRRLPVPRGQTVGRVRRLPRRHRTSQSAGGLPQRLVVHAAMANLPDWVWPLLRREPPPALQRQALNAAVGLLAQPLRWALADGIAAHARRRVSHP